MNGVLKYFFRILYVTKIRVRVRCLMYSVYCTVQYTVCTVQYMNKKLSKVLIERHTGKKFNENKTNFMKLLHETIMILFIFVNTTKY